MRACMILIAVLGTGCFDSIIDSPCIDGYELEAGTCVQRVADVDASLDETVDASDPVVTPDAAPMVVVDAGADAAPDAFVCTADTETDPFNCGECGRVCASGLCTAGVCEGAYAGHIVAIGHDFSESNAPMRHVLANAASLGIRADLGIAHYAPAGSSAAASSSALRTGLATMGRPWHAVALAGPASLSSGERIDVLVIDPLHGDPDAVAADGAAWQPALDRFLAEGGTVIVLEGAGSVTYRFASGAGLYTLAAPDPVSGTPAVIIDAADAVVDHVPSPYLAAQVSVAYQGAPEPVVTTPTGATIVFHLTR